MYQQQILVIEACKTTLNFLEKIPVNVIARCRTE